MSKNQSTLKLRKAGFQDLALLQHWDTQAHVIAADPNDDWNWEEELQQTVDWREQFIAELNGRAIGFIQIIDPAKETSHYWGEVPAHYRAIDIWIGEEKDLGKGYGTRMMNLTLSRCFQDQQVLAVLIDPLASNLRAHQFYERLGFQFIEKRKFDQDDCFVYQLTRKQWETISLDK